MDATVADTAKLVSMVEMRLGIHHADVNPNKRMVAYYRAMQQYMHEHKKNVLSESFKLNGLATAAAALRWRDELLLAGWDISVPAVSERLRMLQEVEGLYADEVPCLAQRISDIVARASGPSLLEGYEVVLACDRELLQPVVKGLLDAIERMGARITQLSPAADSGNNLSKIRQILLSGAKEQIVLDEDDESFQIYEFSDAKRMHEYMALHSEELCADVWVNCANQSMDNWLRMMGKPAAGSVVCDAAPLIVQLFVLATGILKDSIDIISLIDWLYVPVHPLPANFRYALAGRIIKEGGYRNEACRKIIDKYLDGEYEKKKEEGTAAQLKQQRKEREKKVGLYLPSLERTDKTDIDASSLRTLYASLGSWAKQRANHEANKDSKEMTIAQLNSLATLCEALVLLAESADATISYDLLHSWTSALCTPQLFQHYAAQRHGVMLIDSPAKMAATAKRTIWMNIDLEVSRPLDCAFLYPNEYSQIQQHIHLWDKDVENRYAAICALMPFTYTTDRLTIVLCNYRGGEKVALPPILVRLKKQVKNYDHFVNHKLCVPKTIDVEQTDNRVSYAELSFEYADRIEWPDHTSPTVLEMLVQHPFDYTMEKLLGIEEAGPATLPDMKKMKGNVAHAVIAKLFAPRTGEEAAKPVDISKRIDSEYEFAFNEAVDEQGALLLLPQHKLDIKLLKVQLRPCLDNLACVLSAHQLVVTGCEEDHKCDIGVFGSGKDDLHTRLDMTTKDAAGKTVVIDFKWTSSKTYHRDLLSNNRALQLALYQYVLRKNGKDVSGTAYFLMPEGRLYSTFLSDKPHSKRVTPVNNDNIAQQALNSLNYRIKQINAGILELGENDSVDELRYVQDTAAQNLLPLDKDNQGNKSSYIFTNFNSLR